MPEEEEEKTSRMDAAKAFFRAMYAGDEPVPADSEQAAAPGSADTRRVKELEQQARDLEQRTLEAENLYKRMAADFDNFRRRMEREREELSNVGVRKAVEALIPALDDLDRAMLYLSPDTPSEKIIESFQLVASRIMQCLEQAGLKRLKTKGVLFDPHFHEPVQQIETADHPDGTIIHELRAGYALGDRVIRPALVNVSANSSLVIEPLSEQLAPAEIHFSGRTSGQNARPQAGDPASTSATVPFADPNKEEQSDSDPDNKVYELDDVDL